MTSLVQKSRASVAEEHFYGALTWVAVQRITLPVYIFFRFNLKHWRDFDLCFHFLRFHSAVLLIDCWKGSYIADEQSQAIELGEKWKVQNFIQKNNALKANPRGSYIAAEQGRAIQLDEKWCNANENCEKCKSEIEIEIKPKKLGENLYHFGQIHVFTTGRTHSRHDHDFNLKFRKHLQFSIDSDVNLACWVD